MMVARENSVAKCRMSVGHSVSRNHTKLFSTALKTA